MKIKSFISDLHAVTKAKIDEDQTLLRTPSGKIKQDTFFERAVGLGKLVLAKIQGKSYELERISYEEGKTEIENRLKAQYLFFSESNNIDKNDQIRLETVAETFVNSMSADKIFSENPQKAFTEKLRQQAANSDFSKKSPMKTAFKNIKYAYASIGDSNLFKIKAKLLEDYYEKSLTYHRPGNVAITSEEYKVIDSLALRADNLMDIYGEPMGDAITLAKLMNRKELENAGDFSIRYEIAKTFADRHFRRINTTALPINISNELTNTKKIVQLRKNSKECFKHLKDHGMGDKDNWQRLSILIALKLQNSQLEPNFITVEKYFESAQKVYSSLEAYQFERALSNDNFDETLANNLLQGMQWKK